MDYANLKNSAVWGENLQKEYNCNLAFSYVLDISGDITVKLTCSGIYRLTVNGKFIGYGPARTAHGYSKVDEYKVSANGKTVIVVEAVNYNINSYYLIKQDGYFTLTLENGDKVIATSTDFDCYVLDDRIQKVQRFSFQRPFMEAYRFTGEREKLYRGDACAFRKISTQKVACPILLDRDMPMPKLNARKSKCVEKGTVSINNDRPNWVHRSITDISDTLLGYEYKDLEFYASDNCSKMEYKVTNKLCADSVSLLDSEYAVFDFDRNVSGFFSLNVNVKSDAQVYLIFDEVDLDDKEHSATDGINVYFCRNACCNIIYWNAKKGEHKLLSIEANTARYAKIVCLGGEIECSLDMVLYQNDDMYKLKFSCSDKKLEKIVWAGQNSLAQNSVDMIIDCPSRERAGWVNDSWFTMEGEKILSGNVLANKALLESVLLAPELDGLPKGVFPMCYPSDHLDGNFCPTLICWTILDVIKHVAYTGDDTLFIRYKPKMELALEYLKGYENELGLLENLDGWVFIEWSKANDYIDGVHFPTNMLYYGTLKEYAIKTGDKELEKKAENLKTTILNLSYNGEFFLDHMLRENGELVLKDDVSEICQYFAFCFNIANKYTHAKLYDIMIKEFGVDRDERTTYPNVAGCNLITGVYLREEFLFRENEHARMLDELKTIFYPMAEKIGTLTEGYCTGMDYSDNHGLTACTANWIVKAVSGFNSKRMGEYEFLPTHVDYGCEIEIPMLDKTIKFSK